MKTRVLLSKLAKKFPKSIAKKYHDYVGLQFGKLKEDTNTILLCLDFDDIVFEKAKEIIDFNKIDLVISHHPFIYGTFKKVLKNDQVKFNLIKKLEKYNLPIYSYHTNFDEGIDGMNDALAKELGLLNIEQLESIPMARGGYLKEEMDIISFSKYAKEKLDVSYGELLNFGKDKIKSVAIVGGGGRHYYLDAMNEDYDIFISGDIPHHGRRGVVLNKYNYLNLPHEIERIFMKQMKKILLDIDSNLNIIVIDHEELPTLI